MAVDSKYGQPLASSAQAPKNPVLHSFFVNPCSSTNTAGIRLHLGAGGDGVVGRTVSVVDSRRRVLGEGIIGWS
jgi:hypothetical protein